EVTEGPLAEIVTVRIAPELAVASGRAAAAAVEVHLVLEAPDLLGDVVVDEEPAAVDRTVVLAEPVVVAQPDLDDEAVALTEPVIAAEPPAPIAEDRFMPLLDALAETVLAFGREVAIGEPDLVSHRDAVVAWLNEFEQQAGIEKPARAEPVAPPTALAAAEPTAWEPEARERRETLLRAAIEAELRLEIEHEVRARIAIERPEPVSPFLAITARRQKRAAEAGRTRGTALPVKGLSDDPEMREVFALEAAEHLKRIDADVDALRREPAEVERLQSLRRAVHTLKGAAAMMGFAAVAELSHSLEDRLDAATSDGRALDDAALAILFDDLDQLEGLVSGTPNVVALESPASVPETATEELPADGGTQTSEAAAPMAVPVRLERLDHLLTLAGEASVSASRWPEILSGASAALAELRRTSIRVDALLAALQSERHRRLEEDSRLVAQSPQAVAGRQGDFDALELDRYTPTDYVAHELAQIAAETTAAERELTAGIESANELAEQQRRHAAELQDRLLDVRLVPLAELAMRLERAAHGVALRRGKEVEVVFDGTTVAVDRAVLDAVSDALQHLVRNAVDHGIELPAERRARGKSPGGTVSVTARQAQGEVVIEVVDDGAGIDISGVREAARAAGYAGPLLEDDPQQSLALVFRPGVTTAATVDDLSGRGVGLDAVAEALARIKGSVEVASERGSGTIFLLRFPVTLAQARVLMAEVAGNHVALPAASVEHVARLADVNLEETAVGRAARLNGHAFPIASLAAALGWPEAGVGGDPPLIFVEAAGRRAAWIADSVGTHADIVVKSLGGHLRTPRGVAGASLLQDGRVALLLHLPDLLARAGDALPWQASIARPLAIRTPGNVAMRVLVVDDSPTIRKLLVRMLRDLGWQPREAKDGQEALEAIRVDRPDIVLADIEMPRLDGYGLLTSLRSQPATVELPVLMLTSRTADRHRQRAMELGANGYLTKPYRPEDVAAALRRFGRPVTAPSPAPAPESVALRARVN
ncbi:MAG: hybrid sensor histidine kinase/response regulator, partial [Chloroflexota bacterium]